MAAQLMATKLPLRCDCSCNASATNSLPDPVAPLMTTDPSEVATSSIRRFSSRVGPLSPIILFKVLVNKTTLPTLKTLSHLTTIL